MPPRISSHRIVASQSAPCFRTRPKHIFDLPASRSRTFHASHRIAARARPSDNKTLSGTRLRRDMYAWLNGPGKSFRQPLPASTNYLSAYDRQGNLMRANNKSSSRNQQRSPEEVNRETEEDEEEIQRREEEEGVSAEEIDRRAELRARQRMERNELDAREGVPNESLEDLRPYPLNRQFRSQPVLSEALREELYRQVVEMKLDLNSVSAVFAVDVRRVAAVVRLKTIEKQWVAEDKPLVKPYSEAVLAMLPQTPFNPELARPVAHESINDLPVHPATRTQIFYPTPESRAFTRVDAAKAFHDKLLPADDRIPNRQLIEIQQWENAGLDRQTRQQMIREKDEQEREARLKKERRHAAWEKRTKVVVPGRRWDFQFTDISAEKVGKDGRGRNAVGHRYGMPHEDRKRGMVKIPTSVE